jgi:hypothetical protein
MKIARPLLVFFATLLASCAAIQSVVAPTKVDGLAYYMPMKDIVITVTPGDAAKPPAAQAAAPSGTPPAKPVPPKIAIAVTKSYPDRSKPYALRFGTNAFGTHTLDVVVTEQGLLSSAKSTTTSTVQDALKGLASAAGMASVFAMERSEGETAPCAAGDNVFVFTPPLEDTSYRACELVVTIVPLRGSLADGVRRVGIEEMRFATMRSEARKEKRELLRSRDAPQESVVQEALGKSGADETADTQHAGVFYRQELPYLVTVSSGAGVHQAAVVMSPSRSPTNFLPAKRTFFANNKAEFGFTDGVPKSYLQQTEGEGTAIFQVPAIVVGAYFEAAGKMFDNVKNTNAKEIEMLNQELKLELARRKVQACLAAIAVNDTAKIAELGCASN